MFKNLETNKFFLILLILGCFLIGILSFNRLMTITKNKASNKTIAIIFRENDIISLNHKKYYALENLSRSNNDKISNQQIKVINKNTIQINNKIFLTKNEIIAKDEKNYLFEDDFLKFSFQLCSLRKETEVEYLKLFKVASSENGSLIFTLSEQELAKIPFLLNFLNSNKSATITLLDDRQNFYPDGKSLSFSWNSRGKLTQLTAMEGGTNTTFSFSYDGMNRISGYNKTITELGSPPQTEEWNFYYGITGIDKATRIENGVQNLTIDYSTDTNGNILSMNYNETGGYSGELFAVSDNSGNIVAWSTILGINNYAAIRDPNTAYIDPIEIYNPNDINVPLGWNGKKGNNITIQQVVTGNDLIFNAGGIGFSITNPWGATDITGSTTTTTTDDTTDKDGGDDAETCGDGVGMNCFNRCWSRECKSRGLSCGDQYKDADVISDWFEILAGIGEAKDKQWLIGIVSGLAGTLGGFWGSIAGTVIGLIVGEITAGKTLDQLNKQLRDLENANPWLKDINKVKEMLDKCIDECKGKNGGSGPGDPKGGWLYDLDPGDLVNNVNCLL